MDTFNFLEPKVSQVNLVTFGNERVNLQQKQVVKYRDQVNSLRSNMERYMTENPELGLVKLQNSGSLAKGTALSSIDDIDVGLYVKGSVAPDNLGELLSWLEERIKKTYSTTPVGKIYIDDPCVVIELSSGIRVEVAPILWDGDENYRGYMWDRRTRSKILTSITQHLQFIRARKSQHPKHFAQVVRFAKWWARQRSLDTPGFSFSSFLIELIVSKLADDGLSFDNYHEALISFFSYVQNSELKSPISFTDFYQHSDLLKNDSSPIVIVDPVNPENNVAAGYTDSERRTFVECSGTALDFLTFAQTCQTKGEAIQCWQELMGSSFSA